MAKHTRVGILGAGNVGSALGERLAAAGHGVVYGVRQPAAAAEVTVAEAVRGAEVVLLAVPAGVAVEVARAAGDWAGKVLIDCTNPLRWDAGPVWSPPAEGSVAQALAAALPAAAVVKGFNHFGAEIHRDPRLAGGPAEAFFASDHGPAKAQAMELAGQLGFRALDAGPLRNAPLLENLAVLWIDLALARGHGREVGFRFMGRPA